jgi:hypothetical protein
LLLVHYYKWPQLTLNWDSELKKSEGYPDGHILATGVALQVAQNGQNGTATYTYQGQQNETYASFVFDQDTPVVSYVGGQFQAAIPVQPGLTAASLVVMVNIGVPQETIYLDTVGDVTSTCFAAFWYMTHQGEKQTSSPYAGWYAIGGWQPSGSSTLQRKYSGTTNDIAESTTFTLVGSPGP